MTFASVGSAFASTSASFSLTPGGAGDFIIVFAITESTADYASALSSSNVTWQVLLPHQVIGSTYQTVFIGKVTSTSAATVTVSCNAGTPTLRLAGKEFSTTAGYSSVTLDTSGTISATTTLFPSLNPAHGSGECYAGYAFNSATASAGSTSGFTYYVDANGNGLAYNAACANSPQQPAWADTDTITGTAVLLYEAPPVSPLPVPHSAPPAHRSARKGRALGSPGAPRVAVTPPSGAAIEDTTGAPVQDTAGLPVEDTASGPLAPFAQPGRASAGKPAARKGAQAGSPGAAYVYVPVVPAPFAQPDKAVAGRSAVRKGTSAGSPGAPVRPQPALFAQPHKGVRGASPRRAAVAYGSPGAPWSPRLPTATFTQPNKAVAGKRAARKGTASGVPVPASTWPLVQEISGTSTSTTLTLTFRHALTAGNTLIIAMCGFPSGSVSTIAVGGVTTTFVQYAATGSAQIWGARVGTASATVTITTSTAGILAWGYEASGTLTLDTSAANTGTSTSWSSGATGQTIQYWPHFTVGLGEIISNTGSIAGPSSGWLNETAYSNVASAGGHSTGGVSGWRAAIAATAYTYAGTSGSSSAWAAVTASFVVVAPPAATQTGWGGYVFSEHATVGYTGITATFTIQPLSGGTYNSIWVGLGNVYQCGIYQTYDTSQAGNSVTRPWTEMLPGGGYPWDPAVFPTAAGDSLTVSMELTAENWLLTIANNTKGWSYTDVRSVLAVNVGSVLNNGAGPALWPYPPLTAEVIIEDEAGDCANYGSVTFTEITTTPPATRPPGQLITVNAAGTKVAQYPGPYSLQNGTFAMFWNSYS